MMRVWETAMEEREREREDVLVDTACFVLKFEARPVATKYWTFHDSRQESDPEIMLGNEESAYT